MLNVKYNKYLKALEVINKALEEITYARDEDDRTFYRVFNEEKKAVSTVCQYFGCTPIQSLFISAIFEEQLIGSRGFDLQDLTRKLGLSRMDILAYLDELEKLRKMGLLNRERDLGFGMGISSVSYKIKSEVVNALIQNKSIDSLNLNSNMNDMEALEHLSLITVSPRYSRVTTKDMLGILEEEMEELKYLPFVKNLLKLKLSTKDVAVFLTTTFEYLVNRNHIYLSDILREVLDKMVDRIDFNNKIRSGENALIKKGLIEFSMEGSDVIVKPADRCLEWLNTPKVGKTAEEITDNAGVFFLIKAEDIRPKKLEFNSLFREKMFVLEKILQEDQYQNVRKRMSEKGMNPGLTSIFYGAPGTGKTESVLQLAKSTGRSICQIDISQTISGYLGESEKLIKSIFTEYYKIVNRSALTPILFFNEADAVLSQRTPLDNNNPSVSATLNRMQNILLEELERFEGIFIATTNFQINLDPAFERRFLYKLKFETPEADVLAAMWKSKIPHLKPEQCAYLGKHFSLSGGQIENVARKIILNELLHGIRTSFDEVIILCQEERFEAPKNHIGYKLNRA
jgi:DNA-binding MarR family transcriptional regulator